MIYNNCRLCNSKNLKVFLEIPNSSSNISMMLEENELDKVPSTHIKVYKCDQCNFCQLTESLEDEFYDDYIMSTSFSKQMKEYSNLQANKFIKQYNLFGKKIIDVGCGEGGYMTHLKYNGVEAIGIEPSIKFIEAAKDKKLKIHQGYVGIDEPMIPEGKYDAFVTRQVLEHVPDLHDFLQGIKKNLHPGANGLIEVPSLEKAISDKRFYDFFPDHLNYFSKDTLSCLLELNGFKVDEVFDGMNDEYIIAHVTMKDSSNGNELQKSLKDLDHKLNKLLDFAKSNNLKLGVWGAGAKGITTLSSCKIKEGVEYVIDSDENKHFKYTPISNFKIVPSSYIKKFPLDIIVITALAYKNEIVDELVNELKFEGEIYLIEKDLIKCS